MLIIRFYLSLLCDDGISLIDLCENKKIQIVI